MDPLSDSLIIFDNDDEPPGSWSNLDEKAEIRGIPSWKLSPPGNPPPTVGLANN